MVDSGLTICVIQCFSNFYIMIVLYRPTTAIDNVDIFLSLGIK